jgi:hypothetical protein
LGFTGKRRYDVIVFGAGEARTERKVSNGEINRELTTLKRIFNLARQNGKLTYVPHIPMLKERDVRTGFESPILARSNWFALTKSAPRRHCGRKHPTRVGPFRDSSCLPATIRRLDVPVRDNAEVLGYAVE